MSIESEQCDGFTAAGSQCTRHGRKMGDRWYCKMHESQAVLPERVALPELRGRKGAEMEDNFDEAKEGRRQQKEFLRASGILDLDYPDQTSVLRFGGVKAMLAVCKKIGGVRRMLQVLAASKGETIEIGYDLDKETP